MQTYSDHKSNLESNTTRIEDFVFWFSIIDIFFLPYFRTISISFSVPIITLWMVLHYREMLKGKETYVFFFMIFFMIVGTLVGAIYPNSLRWETSFVTTIKRFFQFLICFGYYFFYRSYLSKKKININKILLIFTIIVALFALYFLIDPRNYAIIKIFLNPVDNHTARYLKGTHVYRFNYLWTDPNNIAYLADGIVMWFVINKDESFKNRIVVLLLSIFIIMATSSNGGMAILGIELFALLSLKIIYMRDSFKVRMSTLLGIIIAIVVVIIVLRFTSLYTLIQTKLIEKLFARLVIYSSSTNISGGRLDDLKISFQYLNPLMLFIGSGKEGFSTENGHIYWIGMYGFLAYLCFLYFCFVKFSNISWKRYIWIFPFFFAFTFNIAIGEFKWLAIYFLILAYSRYSLNYEHDE